MRNRAWLVALALTGCALLGAGCRGGDAASPAARSGGTAATSSAAAELLTAAESLRGTSYRFSATTAGIIVTGAADPVAGAATMDVAAAVRIIVAGGGRCYVKFPEAMPGVEELGVDSAKWLRVDLAKIPVGRLGVPNLTDPAGGYRYLRTAKSVQKVGDRRYQGTLDLTKLPSSAADPKVLATFTDSADAVPFEVTLDDKGRLSTMDSTLRINGVGVATHTAFSDYGTTVTVNEPARSEVAEAPPNLYGMLGTRTS
jgi:hypothetical protein